MVGKDLWEGKSRLDREPNVSDACGVECVETRERGEDEFEYGEGYEEVEEELPVWFW